jgi:mono/diheme cytochrome c family protein
LVLGAVGLGCDPNAYDAPPLEPSDGISGSGGGGSGQAGSAGQTSSDSRPVVTAAHRPPPISGGTLLALPEGRAVVSDPDRDRIVTVDVAGGTKLAEISLEPGAEPGRGARDASGRVHVALRGAGELLSLDPATGQILERRPVCRAPRGVVFDEMTANVIVACLEGILVELPAAGGPALRTTPVAPDLRDAVFLGTTLVVTRFRSAEILYLDAERKVTKRVTPRANDPGIAATTAWRAVPTPDGGLLIAHQTALETSIDIGPTDPGVAGSAGAGGSGSGYGSAFNPCASIVRGAMTLATPEGSLTEPAEFPLNPLPVDIAISPSGFVATAHGAFRPELTMPSATRFELARISGDQGGFGCDGGFSFDNVAPTSLTTAVAFDDEERLLMQTRQPSELWVIEPTFLATTIIELGGADVTDTGHEIFHADTGSGISCASCHAEGTDDGHVWNFVGLGAKRTQPLDVGLEGLAPFHWNGELASFGDLVHEVFERRMGGPLESPERIAALERYVYGMKPRAAVRAADDPAALRGKALFESAEVACATCHTGPKLTNGESKEIGKESATQVPSLIGVSARAPYMHDGCAPTLRDRFDPACGGTEHGHAEILDDTQLSELIAYLESL